MKEPLLRSPIQLSRLAAIAAFVLACTGRELTAPRRTSSPGMMSQVGIRSCQELCVIANDTRAMRAAAAPTDTSDATLRVADFHIAGEIGAEIKVTLDADSTAFSRAFLQNHRMLVTIDGVQTAYALSDLSGDVVIYRFDRQHTAHVRYELPRQAGTIPNARMSLFQSVSAAANVVDSETPWASATSTADENACHVTAPGYYCGVTVSFDHWAAGSPFGEFQYPAGSGVSQPINITFSEPVDSIAIIIADPDFGGNTLTVNGAGGSQTYSFTGDGTPFNYTEDAVGTTNLGVTSITLTPAANDYVAYRNLTFVPNGEPGLFCNNGAGQRSPVRGATVQCRVKGNGVVVTSWSFTGPSHNGSSNITTSEISSSLIWEGVAVASGTVTAEVTVNGTRRDPPLSANFTVLNRNDNTWHWGTSDGSGNRRGWSYEQGTAQDCAPPGDVFADGQLASIIGWNTRLGGCDGNTVWPLPRTPEGRGAYQITPVASGPNKDLWYVTAASGFRLDRRTSINYALKPGNPPVYQLVDRGDLRNCAPKGGTAITSANFYTFNTSCMKLTLEPGFFAGLYSHEGYGNGTNNGHQAQLETNARFPNLDLYSRLERVFAKGEADTHTEVENVADAVAAQLNPIATSHVYVGNNFDVWVYRWSPSYQRFFKREVSDPTHTP